PSRSMAPAIPEGSRVMVDTWYYRHATPRRGDVIVAMSPMSPGILILKRVVAVGGETVEVRGDTVLVNGTPIHEPMRCSKGPCLMKSGTRVRYRCRPVSCFFWAIAGT
ncbi:MAG TPA: signal peptidase I, partial [Candidatus Angelobacter sp.]